MIESSATSRLIQTARDRALSSIGGGLEKKLNDLQSYGATGVSSGVSFGISHIPLVGPILAKAFDLAAGMGLDKLYETLRDKAASREERIVNALFVLERSLAASLRQAYNTVHDFENKAGLGEKTCRDCQDAAKEARFCFLSQNCVGDIEAGIQILEQLVVDLKADVSILKGHVDQRVTTLVSRIDNFRDHHPGQKCMGMETCYWIKGPGTPFSSTTFDDGL